MDAPKRLGRPPSGRKHLTHRFAPHAHQWLKDNREALEAWAKAGKPLPLPPSSEDSELNDVMRIAAKNALTAVKRYKSALLAPVDKAE